MVWRSWYLHWASSSQDGVAVVVFALGGIRLGNVVERNDGGYAAAIEYMLQLAFQLPARDA
jgi:hypothetical protein